MSDITETVRARYAEAARRVGAGQAATCGCGTGAAIECCDPITSNLYDATQAGELPAQALQASLGCGNPTALASLEAGQTVLDLGSGGGIDVLLSARRVGPTGKAYGLDMTDEMLDLARANAATADLGNVEFLKGQIEAIPLPDATVDVIISNCVINLAADKAQVLREAFRVLKPGGRFAVSDVVMQGEVPEDLRRSMELWVGCVAGALSDREYRHHLAAAGFEEIEIETTRVYDVNDARVFLSESGLDVEAIAPLVNGRITSAFVRARRPVGVAGRTGAPTSDDAIVLPVAQAAAACCGPGCCA